MENATSQSLQKSPLFLRIGAISSMASGILTVVADALHPRVIPGPIGDERLISIATTSYWSALHLLPLCAIILLVFGFASWYRIIEGLRAQALAYFAYAIGLVTSALSLVLISVDGFVIKRVADMWYNAPQADKAATFYAAKAVEHLNLEQFNFLLILYFGLTFVLYGIAVACSTNCPRLYGWFTIIGGSLLMIVGLAQIFIGVSSSTVQFFVALLIIQPLWAVGMGLLVWRKATITQ